MEADHPELGELIGAYRLDAEIGRGGMGRVYRASHHLLGRRVAIKVLAPALAADQEFVSRFFYEARVVNDIRHPNIIDIIDFISTENPRRVAYVMEILDGVSLGTLLKSEALSVRQAVNATFQLANALEAVHRLNVIHRDLKPDNIFVVQPLDSDLSVVPSIKILDFGIAKTLDASSGPSHHTTTGAVLGTPAYMAPEQIDGAAIGPAADIYALGEIFYEMISGLRLFSGSNTAIFTAKVAGDAPSMALPEELPGLAIMQQLVARTIEVDPGARPTLAEVKASLLEILEAQPAHAGRASRPPPPPSPPRPISARPLNTLDGRTLPPIVASRTPRKGPVGMLVAALIVAVIAGAAWVLRPAEEPVLTMPVPPPPPAREPAVAPVVARPQIAPVLPADAIKPVQTASAAKRLVTKPEGRPSVKGRVRSKSSATAPLKRDEMTEW